MSRFLMMGLAWAAAAAVAGVPVPASAGDDAQAPPRLAPFDLSAFPDDAHGVVAVRPSALFRAEGMGPHRLALNLLIAQQWAGLAKRMGVDVASAPRPLRVEMIAQILVQVSAGPCKTNKGSTWTLSAGERAVIRMVDPFDWPAFLRSWKLELTEARAGDRAYYRVPNPFLGRRTCVACPDDRTLIVADEPEIGAIVGRPAGAASAIVAGRGADRLLRGLALVALNNRDDALARALGRGTPESSDLNLLFDHAARWAVGVAEAPGGLALEAEATCPDDLEASRTVLVGHLLKAVLRLDVRPAPPADAAKGPDPAPDSRITREAVERPTIVQDGRSVRVRTRLGTLSEMASLLGPGARK